jgi:hypothetical protein
MNNVLHLIVIFNGYECQKERISHDGTEVHKSVSVCQFAFGAGD